jgi:ribosomal protein S18 acetylase RimI-like enzyme
MAATNDHHNPLSLTILGNQDKLLIEQAIAFIRDIFLVHEPITAVVNARDTAAAADLFNTLTAGLPAAVAAGGASIVARDTTGQIVGAFLCEELVEEEEQQATLEGPSSLVASVLPFFDELRRDFERLRSPHLHLCGSAPNKTLHICIVAVSTEHQGKGIAGKLLRTAMEEAHRLGFDDMVTEATSESQILFEKAGFHTLKYIPYSEYEYQGQRPLVDARHHGAKLMWRPVQEREHAA